MSVKVPFEDLGYFVRDQLRQELEDQGHVLTRKLWNSIEFKISQDGSGDYVLTFYSEDYGLDLDTGIPGSLIPQTGPKADQRIRELEIWVKRRNIAKGKAAGKVAYLIHRKHTETQMPTKESRKFSKAKNNRRTGWIKHTLKENETLMKAFIREDLLELAVQTLFSILREILGSERVIILSN